MIIGAEGEMSVQRKQQKVYTALRCHFNVISESLPYCSKKILKSIETRVGVMLVVVGYNKRY